MRSLAANLATALAASLIAAACSAFNPETGPERPGDDTATPATGGYGYGDGAVPVDGAADPRCAADGGIGSGACDLCENAKCCTTRFACYDWPACAAGNTKFDACIEATDGGTPASAAVAQCWATYSASGTYAKARIDCQRAKCKTECEVP